VNVLVYGATGMVGEAIVGELLDRGHRVTAASRRGVGPADRPGLTVVAADVTDRASVGALAPGHDAVVTAVRPAAGEGPDRVVEAARSLVATLPTVGVHRVLAVGGAGGLQVAPGVRVVDDPDFSPVYRPFSLAHVDALSVYAASDTALVWTMICCPRVIEPGERSGRYRVGGEELLSDGDGVSRITNADYAVALADELERTPHPRARISVAY
jgi:putative NADH-flavin reductase